MDSTPVAAPTTAIREPLIKFPVSRNPSLSG